MGAGVAEGPPWSASPCGQAAVSLLEAEEAAGAGPLGEKSHHSLLPAETNNMAHGSVSYSLVWGT